MSSILEITKKLEQITDSDCFYADADEILATYTGKEINFDEFRTIFSFLENNPDLDYGAPPPP